MLYDSIGQIYKIREQMDCFGTDIKTICDKSQITYQIAKTMNSYNQLLQTKLISEINR